MKLEPIKQIGFKDMRKLWKERRLRFDEPMAVHRITADELAQDNFLIWLGHASFLLKAQEKVVLIDPHFGPTASPVKWAGPKREIGLPIEIKDLPAIDLIAYTHNHYDHLDLFTLKSLRKEGKINSTQVLVPSGLKNWFKKLEIKPIEFEWWQEKIFEEWKITFVPARHYSRRHLFDRDKSLWGGWIFEISGKKFYFMGDSGYGPHFKEIGKRLGPFDLACIGIGAYEPRWAFGSSHICPEEAVQAHLDLGSKRSIGMHFGTFHLTLEDLNQAPRDLESAMQKAGVTEFITLQPGALLELELPCK